MRSWLAITILAAAAASVAQAQEAQAPSQPAPPQAQPALPQAQAALRLTLDEAQARALKSSHRLAEVRAREAVARAAVDARLALERPSIAATAGYTRTNHVVEFSFPGPNGPRVVYPDVPNNYQARLDLQWPIYAGGRTDALERAARAEAAAVGAEAEAARADLRLEVARAYWAVVTARASVAVLQQAVSRSESHIGDVRARFNAGLVAPNETASADAQASRARMLLIEARNQRDAAAADLARLVGEDLLVDIEPAATLEERSAVTAAAGPLFSVSALAAQARSGRAERTAMARRIDAAEAQGAAAAAARRPSVVVTGGFDYARPNARIFPRADRWDESWDAGAHVSWSLWDGGRAAAEIAQAMGVATAARARLADFDAVLAVDVRQRTLDIESGLAAVQAAADGITAAEAARRVVSERYRAGVIAQGEVLDAELALLQAQLDRTRALAGVKLAEARLARAVGR
jgi:outer membrane protein TolC